MRDLNVKYEEGVDLRSLVDFDGNPNVGADGAVGEMIEANGWYGAIVADVDTRQIVAGHTRRRALLAAGETTGPVQWIRTDGREHAARILLADNRSTRLGSDDLGLAAALLKGLAETEGGLAGTGFDAADLDALLAAQAAALAELEAAGRPDAPDEAPDVPDVPVTRTGDVWVLGDHRLLCGDATDREAYAVLLGGETADLVWTDPPYGVAVNDVEDVAEAVTLHRRTDGKLVPGDDLDAADLTALWTAAVAATVEVTRPGAAWFVAAPPGPNFLMFAGVLADRGIWRQTLVWLKDRFAFGRSDYHYRHENVLYGWSPGGAHREPPDRTQDTVWEVPRPGRSETHPTMKPVELVARALRNHTVAGGLVLDPFGGSGSTLMACEQEGRRGRLMEVDAGYCDVTCARFQAHTGVVPVRDGDPHNFSETIQETSP